MPEKKTLDSDFDVVSVINKTYHDSTEYDLNDSLIFLGNVISKTKLKNKELVKKNFSKFVECRIVLEEILNDMKKKGLDKEMSSKVRENIKGLESKFTELTKNVLIDSQHDDNQEKRSLIVKRYKTLFTLPEQLQDNIRHKERFVDIYLEGLTQYEELKKSKYVQNIWEKVIDIRKVFLEEVYREIQNQDNSFIEVLYYFNLYFKISETKSDRKIMNTLLLNFKEKVLDVPYVEKGYYLKEINYFFLKTIVHLDKDLQRELIKTLFKKIREVSSTYSLPFIKIWAGKYKELIHKVEVPLEISSVYDTTLKFFKRDLISDRILSTTSMDKLLTDFKFFDEMLDKDEKYILHAHFIKVIKEKEVSHLSYKEMADFVKELDQFDIFIKGSSDLFDDFEDFKKSLLNRELRKEIASFSKFIQTTENKASVLMEVVRIIDRAPTNYHKIVTGASPSFEKDKTLLYFLHGMAGKEEPTLTNSQREEVERLEKQFGYLKNVI